MFSKLEKETLKQIRDSDNKTLLTGKDKNGIPFLNHIFVFHKKIFGETCSSCPSKILDYIQKLKNFNSSKMENSKKNKNKFTLANGTLLVFAGTSRSYSKHNITDEVAMEYLAKNPNRKTLFSKVPDNLEKLIDTYKQKQEKATALALAKKLEDEAKAATTPIIPLVPAQAELNLGTPQAVESTEVKGAEVVTANLGPIAPVKDEVKPVEAKAATTPIPASKTNTATSVKK